MSSCHSSERRTGWKEERQGVATKKDTIVSSTLAPHKFWKAEVSPNWLWKGCLVSGTMAEHEKYGPHDRFF